MRDLDHNSDLDDDYILNFTVEHDFDLADGHELELIDYHHSKLIAQHDFDFANERDRNVEFIFKHDIDFPSGHELELIPQHDRKLASQHDFGFVYELKCTFKPDSELAGEQYLNFVSKRDICFALRDDNKSRLIFRHELKLSVGLKLGFRFGPDLLCACEFVHVHPRSGTPAISTLKSSTTGKRLLFSSDSEDGGYQDLVERGVLGSWPRARRNVQVCRVLAVLARPG